MSIKIFDVLMKPERFNETWKSHSKIQSIISLSTSNFPIKYLENTVEAILWQVKDCSDHLEINISEILKLKNLHGNI